MATARMTVGDALDELQDGYVGWTPEHAQRISDSLGVTTPVPTFTHSGKPKSHTDWQGPAGTFTDGFSLARHIANGLGLKYDQPYNGRGRNHREVLAAIEAYIPR